MTTEEKMHPALELESVSKKLASGFIPRKKQIIENLSLSVRQGEIFGFLGPNGSGKTTTIKLIMGLLFPDSGSIRIFGKDNIEKSCRSGVGFLPEEPSFYDYLKGREFLNFCAMLLGMNIRERKERVDELLELVSIENSANLQLRKYSKGMKQRIAMAQALLSDPELLVLDEPMSGLDPLGRYQMRDIILRLKAGGKTVFFSSHILADAEMICDRAGLLSNGRLISLEDIKESPKDDVDHYELLLRGLEEKDLAGYEILSRKGEFYLVRVYDSEGKNRLIKRIFKKKAELRAVTPHRHSLEEVFMKRIKG